MLARAKVITMMDGIELRKINTTIRFNAMEGKCMTKV